LPIKNLKNKALFNWHRPCITYYRKKKNMKDKKEREDDMEKNMEKKKVIDRRSIKLEHILKPDYIPFLSGRPSRETVIGKDDVMNLEILINMTNSVEEFVKSI
jgi:hypothetical protein